MIKYLPIIFFFFSINANAQNYPDSNSVKEDSLKTENIKDTINADIPEGLTAKDIINNYISAIGGSDKIYSIVDRTTIMRGSVQGINITIVSYQKAPDKIKQQIKAGSNEQLIIFDGEKGIMKMAGEKQEITGAELEKLKFEATLTLLTDPELYGIQLSLEGTEMVEGKDMYKIIMTLPSGIKWTQFYDVESGLKVKEQKYINSPMGLFQQEIIYDDYKEVEGILYPFKIKQSIGAQSMEFIISSIKINTDLADREFELE